MEVPLQPGWEDRVKLKLGWTAAATAVFAAQHAHSKHRSVLREIPRQVFGYSAAMGVFCGIQEGLRAARGVQDPLNSLVAGAVAGAAAAGYYQGPQYRLLAAVLWGPICGGAHLLNDLIHPRFILEDWLISEGLLDPRVRGMRPSLPAPQPLVSDLPGGAATSNDDLVEEATKVRDRELMQLLGLQQRGVDAISSSGGPAAAPAQAAAGGVGAARAGQAGGAGASGRRPDGAARRHEGAQPKAAFEQEQDTEDEEDFRRWLASARATGMNVILDDDELPAPSRAAARASGQASSGSGSSSSTAGEGAAARRTWWGWVRGQQRQPSQTDRS